MQPFKGKNLFINNGRMQIRLTDYIHTDRAINLNHQLSFFWSFLVIFTTILFIAIVLVMIIQFRYIIDYKEEAIPLISNMLRQ